MMPVRGGQGDKDRAERRYRDRMKLISLCLKLARYIPSAERVAFDEINFSTARVLVETAKTSKHRLFCLGERRPTSCPWNYRGLHSDTWWYT